jgi:O-methyltransferase
MKRIVKKISSALSPQKTGAILPQDFDEEKKALIAAVAPYTMTGPERIFALNEAVKYVIENNIEGDFVECGVWKGGSTLAVALTLEKLGITNRNLYLYDTFDGSSGVTEVDVDLNNESALELMKTHDKEKHAIWSYSGIDEVKRTMMQSKYPADKIIYVKGMVEDTLPQSNHEKIALLRLDTDWYQSTRAEMEILYPKLVPGGVLIIDDYGYWQGAKKAVDEYIQQHKLKILLNRIDFTGRMAVKP